MPSTRKNRAADSALPAMPSELIDQIGKRPTSADGFNAASPAVSRSSTSTTAIPHPRHAGRFSSFRAKV